MKVELLFFAQVKDAFGDGEILAVDEGATVAEVVDVLRSRPQWRAVEDLPLRYAVNQVVVGEHTALSDGDVVALLPPVSGG